MLGKRQSKAPEKKGTSTSRRPGLSFAQPKGGMSKDRGTETQGAAWRRRLAARPHVAIGGGGAIGPGAARGRAGKRAGSQAAERPPAAKRAPGRPELERPSHEQTVDAYDPQAEASRPQLAGGDAQSDEAPAQGGEGPAAADPGRSTRAPRSSRTANGWRRSAWGASSIARTKLATAGGAAGSRRRSWRWTRAAAR